MRHLWRLTGASALALLVFALPAAAVPDQGKKDEKANDKSTKHNFKSPMAEKQDALLQNAIQAKLNGKASGKVHEVAKGQFVQLEREGTDRVFAIIAEFGNARHSAAIIQDAASDGTPQLYDGPLHNEIPEPDRTVDNTTLCTSTGWRSTSSTSPRTATRSRAMSTAGSRCRSTRPATAATSAAGSSATTPGS